MRELFETMSTAISHLNRFDVVAMHVDDKAMIGKVSKKISECSKFVERYARITGFGQYNVDYWKENLTELCQSTTDDQRDVLRHGR